jgi:hypothetical protein
VQAHRDYPNVPDAEKVIYVAMEIELMLEGLGMVAGLLCV